MIEARVRFTATRAINNHAIETEAKSQSVSTENPKVKIVNEVSASNPIAFPTTFVNGVRVERRIVRSIFGCDCFFMF